jgi:PPM family protein phosphatase
MLMFDGVEVDVHGRSHIGRVRSENQDQYLIAALHKVVDLLGTSIPDAYSHRFDSGARALLLLVADGVGGGVAGDEAASVTLDAIVDYVTNSMRCFYKLDEQIPHDLLAELAATVERSHAAVLSRAETTPDRLGMATTLTMAHVLWPRAYVVHIGDSRCYHFRSGEVSQVTKDQTVVQELLDAGALSPEEAARSPYSSVLSQAIGGGGDVRPAISKVDLAAGDALLLCTDGLTAHLSDEQIGAVLGQGKDAAATCDRFVETALDGGGSDNVTVVVGKFG